MDLIAELARHGPGAPRAKVSLDEARAYCRHLATSHYENFPVVSSLFPVHLHQHLCNVYAYCRWADDLADESQSREQALALLSWWEAQLDAMLAGQASHPVFVALANTAKEFRLPREPLADLLAAFRRDQTQSRYETLAELITYCDQSANPVGRILLHLGRAVSKQHLAWSDSICTALQLANFWQDVRRDFERGRVYIPQELCRQYDWPEARFAVGRCDDRFRDLLRTLVFDAETRLQAGERLVGSIGADLRPSLRCFVGGGYAILAAIRRYRYDVWTRRPTVGPLTKLGLLATAWWRGEAHTNPTR